MPSIKRKEISSPPKMQGKKRVKDTVAEKLTQQLKEVEACLQNASISPEVLQLLCATLPLSLGVHSDRRHKFQEQVVDCVGQILGEVDANLGKELADARSRRDETQALQPSRDAEVAAVAERLRNKQAEVQSLKMNLAEKAKTFRAATSSLTEAETAKAAEEQHVQEAEKMKREFEVALEDLASLKMIATTETEACQKRDQLMGLLRRCKFEESMLIALPAALAKEPEARGQFDLIAVTQLESDIGKKIAEQEAILTAAQTNQERCGVAVSAARERLAETRAAQRVAAKAFDEASSEQAACEAACEESQKAVRELAQSLNRLGKSVYSAEAEIEAFKEGAFKTFSDLRERVTPLVEETVDAPAPMVPKAAGDADSVPLAEVMPAAS